MHWVAFLLPVLPRLQNLEKREEQLQDRWLQYSLIASRFESNNFQIGDDKSAIEAIVSANEELVKLPEDVAALQNSEEEDNHYDDAGEKLAEMYDQLQLMGSDVAEAQASKILAGLGFTKDMQGRPTLLNSGGG
ncbi:hypothetical protein ACLB2K_046513 [Fragaria x ananassa]